ncbi:hypothetical protein [Rhizobium sp. RU36D]|uniref:hypothetical protein n=1 Tax=Rhizobium sp. RU36D TaxID=1907415 RepID=UPI0009D90D97|nr:hypothetical protein [Rhizobium sp. RU36D]SMD08716.1 hypothetical protein SAMN05880593_12053 [Rhizobium sp. RU36D]
MQTTIDHPIEPAAAPHFKVVSVAEFCRKFRLNPKEERRLRLLFGATAREHELLRHATREPRFR